MGIPSIYLNDNEHAKGNYIAFMFASLNILPEFLKKRSSELRWNKKYNIDFYPGIKEGIYLSQMTFSKKDNIIKKDKKVIYIRLEPWAAQYYSEGSYFIDNLIKELKKNYQIILLPRGEKQALHYKTEEFIGIKIVEKPLRLINIYKDCDLFIGAGGSMTREMAFLGIPTISIYQDKLLEVDKYLIDQKFMYHKKNLQKKDVEKIINDKVKNINNNLKNKGIAAYNYINKIVIQYAKI